MNIIRKPCTNFTAGRAGYKPELIVIHVMDGSLVGTDAWFNNPASQVSAHYGIGLKGEVHQYVKETDRAWHAGRVKLPIFNLYKKNGVNPNLYTIGIEHEGKATTTWTAEMKNASAALIRRICADWNIPIDRDHVIGHYEVYAGKPNCPATGKAIIDELVKLAQGSTLGKEMAGRILLAPEDHGSLWYVTLDGRRIKLGRSPEEVDEFLKAVQTNKLPHTGINNSNLNLIPLL